MRYIWMPRLVERIQAASGSSTGHSNYSSINHNGVPISNETGEINNPMIELVMPEPSGSSLESLDTQVSPVSDVTEYQNPTSVQNVSGLYPEGESDRWIEMEMQSNIVNGGESLESLWNEENIWFLQQQLM